MEGKFDSNYCDSYKDDCFGPDPHNPYPILGYERMVFLKNFIKSPNIIVGDYTYYDDPKSPENFERDNVLYHHEFCKDKLIIGKYCAIASGTTFLMSGANHKMDGITGYPFKIYKSNGWGDGKRTIDDVLCKSDTVVGNDVWFGYQSLIMPGINIGDGSIIATRSVVTKDVPPYTLVGGNPAKMIRKRFDDEIISLLLEIRWWDWSQSKIVENMQLLTNFNLNDLKKLVESKNKT